MPAVREIITQMLNVYIHVRAVIFTPGAGVEKKPRSVKLVYFFFYFAYIVRARLFNFVADALNGKRRVIKTLVNHLFKELFGNDRVSRRNHFL